MNDTTTLDQEEILHLAMEALRRDDHGAALAQLKAGAARFPDSAKIAFLLAAEHAQIGMFDRAEEEFVRAITLEPDLAVARFQLGLLQLTQNRLGDARVTWQRLESLAPSHALRLFKQGLEALAEDRFDETRKLIEEGMRANDFSPDLNRDMANLLTRIAESTGQAVEPQATDASPLWFNAYRNPDQPN